jgi:hypothetical protein
MNTKQKKVAVAAIIFIFLTLIWHPYNLMMPDSSHGKDLLDSGYKFIWESGAYEEFDYVKLLVEWLAILIISALAYKICESDDV